MVDDQAVAADATILVAFVDANVYAVNLAGVNPFSANVTCIVFAGSLFSTIIIRVLPVEPSAA